MITNAQKVREYTIEIAKLESEKADTKQRLEIAIKRGVGEIEAIIWLSGQIINLAQDIGKLMSLRAVYAKEHPDADYLDTIPF